MKPFGRIYVITNLITHQQYVGQTTRTLAARWDDHLHNAADPKEHRRLCVAIRRYGPSSFIIKELRVCYSRAELDRWEKIYITRLNTFITGYNMTPDGQYHHRTHSKKTSQPPHFNRPFRLLKMIAWSLSHNE